jgi:hypothetical protein
MSQIGWQALYYCRFAKTGSLIKSMDVLTESIVSWGV